MSGDFGLTVRRHERHDISVDVVLYIGQESSALVRFAPESGAGGGSFPATLVDLSDGGMGLRSRYFVPRKCVLHVKIIGADGSIATPLLEADIRVQRVRMIDRSPTYFIGTAFVEAGPALKRDVKALIERFEREAATQENTSTEGGRAQS